MPEFITQHLTPQLFVSLHVLIILVHVVLISVAYSIYLERKISAYIQDRVGPNRTGFDFGLPWLKFLSQAGITKGLWGLGQPLADGLKFLLKEDYRPTGTDKVLFTLGPVLIIIPALIGFVIIPWGGQWDMPAVADWGMFHLPVVGGALYALLGWMPEMFVGDGPGGVVHVAGASVNVGVIYLLAVGSLGVYGVTIGGWASNNKYSFLGGMRATAQMISYEIPMGMALLATLLMMGTFLPEEIIAQQREHTWGLVSMPVAGVLFFICCLAEANRAPFDNAEAEQELIGGYHTEYSSMRFALFFLAEYAHMITGMAFFTLLFLGGWQILPGIEIFPEVAGSFWIVLAKFGVFFSKVMLLICFQMVIRWTLPRLRYDQIMMLGWQSMIPIGLCLVVATSVMVHFGWTGTIELILMNIAIALGIVLVQNMFPKSTRNKKIEMYGSRFNPVAGTSGGTAPKHPTALEDRPVQGIAPAV
ncbi:MAG: NADH-quinone oxidoreductase subunit H 1 [Phycisphaeraceae bacterium]|nr:MAG: NADH-quinone oxidoreductase subunit H 1 [Phycisphaeraceae bacterium]